jgi:amino acid/amide ABC transporter substrate-binding protein, HAAT family (TC 3.A.1.4.-)
MKKRIKSWKFIPCLVLLLVLSLVVGGCGANSQKAGDGKEAYKIGAVIDISGNSSSLGVPERDTLKMMVEQLNAKGGINGHPVELEILDNKSTEQEAVTAVKGLIDKGVLAVIGCSSSGTSMAMIPTVQNAKIPMISMAAASSIVEPVGERQWVFKTPQSDIVMVDKIIGYLQSNNLQKVAFMSMNNSYGDGGKKAFAAAAQENNITVVTEEKFDATDKDMTPQLTRVKASGAQAVIVWAIPPSASILTKNFKDMGLTIPLIHSHGVGNQSFIDLAQGAADGVILPIGKLTVADQIPADDPQKKILDSYITDYTKKYNSAPNSFGGYAVDAFNLLVNAIEKAGADRAAIRDQLEKTQGYTGISGIFNMSAQDHNGLKPDSAVMVRIENGKWKLIK